MKNRFGVWGTGLVVLGVVGVAVLSAGEWKILQGFRTADEKLENAPVTNVMEEPDSEGIDSADRTEPTEAQSPSASGSEEEFSVTSFSLAETSSDRTLTDAFVQVLSSKNPTGNWLFSPYSARAALTLVAEGTAGPGRLEIQSAIGPLVIPTNAPRDVAVANAIWFDRLVKVKPAYERNVSTTYGAKVSRADMRGNPSAAAASVNSWVSEKTSGKIPELVSADHLRNAQVALLNAVYFKSEWEESFSKDATRSEIFRGLGGEKLTVSMMNGERRFSYFEDERVQIAKLNFKDDSGVSLTIAIPRKTEDLNGIRDYLTTSRDLVLPFVRRRLDVKIPKFRIETFIDLLPVLSESGIKTVLGSGADFSPMVDSEPGGLRIGAALQKIFFKVDEEGSEAAAATAFVMAFGGAAGNSNSMEPIPFHATRPFWFVLRGIRKNEEVYFIGRVVKPDLASKQVGEASKLSAQ